MKIIYAHNFYRESGGEDESYRAQVSLLRANAHEVFTFTRSNADASQMNFITAGTRMIWSREAASELGMLIRKTNAELVHFHNTFFLISPSAYYMCKSLRVPVVQDLRNYRLLCPVATFVRNGRLCEDCLGKTPPLPSVLHACWRDSRMQTAAVASMLTIHRVLRTWERKIDMFVALTKNSRQKFVEGGLPPERIAVKPNFFTPPVIPETSRGDFALYAGRLSPEKGIATLLQAWESVDSMQLKIVGDGPLAHAVQSATLRNPNIEWLRHQPHDRVLELMRSAYILIFPSIWNEPFGNSIIEAFASGLPVVASRIGSMTELISDGKTGIHFHPGDELDLAAKVRWAQSNANKIKEMRKFARQEHDSKFTAQKNYEILMQVYDSAKKFAQSGR